MIRELRWALLASSLFASAAAAAEPNRHWDRDVEAALVFNLLKFVEWPPDAAIRRSSGIEICVVQDPSFAHALRLIGDKTIGGKRMEVREPLDGASSEGCHVVFLGQTERERLPRLALDLAARGLLTISDTPGFGERGMIVNFFIEEDRVGFEVNLNSAQRARLKLSSKILRLARIIKTASMP